jgi:hypothetical protein
MKILKMVVRNLWKKFLSYFFHTMFDQPVNLVNREQNIFFNTNFFHLISKKFDFPTEHVYLTNKKTGIFFSIFTLKVL